MLFLAVFCGFLAEYQLEHKIEKDRERVYIKSMIEDLKEDTTRIKPYIRATNRFQKNRDSLINLLGANYTNPDSIKKAYRLAYSYAFARAKFYFSDRTMTQLKNAGGLRLIKNKVASDSIIGYDKGIQHVEFLSDAYDIAVHEGVKNSFEVFNYTYTRDTGQFNLPTFKPELLTSDKTIVVRYLNSLIKWNAVSANYFNAIERQRETAIRLIIMLQNKYGLK